MTPDEKIEALREWLGNRHSSCRCMICIELLDPIRDIIDPPKPKWREAVDERFGWAAGTPSPLGSTLRELADLEYGKVDSYADPTTVCLARIVAIAEAQVGDGWEADPDSTAYGCAEQDVYDAFILLDPLANLTGSLCWKRVGDRAAAWLRSLTDGGAA